MQGESHGRRNGEGHVQAGAERRGTGGEGIPRDVSLRGWQSRKHERS